MKRVIVLLPLLLLALFMLPRGRAKALGISGLSITAMDCVGFTYTGYTATFDRDNTGAGNESYELTVRDSANTLLFLSSGSAPLGSFPSSGGTISYDLASPINGDLTLQYKSLAGNGFEEQVAYSYTGLCSIPTATPTLTPTATPTPTPTNTPAPAPTATAISDVYQTVVFGDTAYEVHVSLEVSPADAAIISLLTIIVLLLMLGFIREVIKRG